MKVWSRFSWDDGATSFRGVHDPSARWNGWACPSFPLDEALRILEVIGSDDSDEVGYSVQDGEIGNEIEGVWFPLVASMVEGIEVYPIGAHGWVEVYPIGAHGWVWDEVESAEGY